MADQALGIATATDILCPECVAQKVVPIWKRPFTEVSHARIVANYYKFSAEWEIDIADVSPPGWAGQRDPCIVVMGRKL